jgi:hypothetical protein
MALLALPCALFLPLAHAGLLAAWLVDIRHEAAHTQLPALSLLREASAEALDWLNEYYWAAQELSLKSYNHRGMEGLVFFFATMPSLDPSQQEGEVQRCADHIIKLYGGIRVRLVLPVTRAIIDCPTVSLHAENYCQSCWTMAKWKHDSTVRLLEISIAVPLKGSVSCM